MEQTKYVIVKRNWEWVTKRDDGFDGWPDRAITPELSKQDALAALDGIQSRSVIHPENYMIVPSWWWESNRVHRSRGLSSDASVPNYVKYVPGNKDYQPKDRFDLFFAPRVETMVPGVMAK